MLQFNSVSLWYDDDVVLSDVSFSVKSGECVAVLGRSGAGKSSIFKMLIGEVKPTSGEILVEDINLSNLTLSSLQAYRREIGVVFQDYKLLEEKTVFENIAYALEVCNEADKVVDRVPELLDIMGLTDRQEAFPRELSGGERQRTALARALVHRPQVLIADEATGNLDPKTTREVGEILKTLHKQGLTIIFSTHDPVLVEVLRPRVIRIDDGVLRFDKPQSTVDEAFIGMA